MWVMPILASKSIRGKKKEKKKEWLKCRLSSRHSTSALMALYYSLPRIIASFFILANCQMRHRGSLLNPNRCAEPMCDLMHQCSCWGTRKDLKWVKYCRLELCPGGHTQRGHCGEEDIAFYHTPRCAANLYHLGRMMPVGAGTHKVGHVGKTYATLASLLSLKMISKQVNVLKCWNIFSIPIDDKKERNDMPLRLKVVKTFTQSIKNVCVD